MDFSIGDMFVLEKFENGDNEHFMLEKNDDGAFDVAMMTPIGGDPAAFKDAMKSMMGEMNHMPEMRKSPGKNTD